MSVVVRRASCVVLDSEEEVVEVVVAMSGFPSLKSTQRVAGEAATALRKCGEVRSHARRLSGEPAKKFVWPLLGGYVRGYERV